MSRRLVNLLRLSLLMMALGSGICSTARADLLYSATTQGASSFNNGNVNNVTLSPIFVNNPTAFTQVTLSDVSVGIRRQQSGGNLTAVDVEIYAAAMTPGAGSPPAPTSVVSLGIFNLPASASAVNVTQTLTATPLNVTLALENTTMANFGGLYIGVRFFGANGTSTLNGWRTVTGATVGVPQDFYYRYDVLSMTVSTQQSFGGTPPAFFFTVVNGTLSNASAVPEPSSLTLAGVAVLAFAWRSRRRLATQPS